MSNQFPPRLIETVNKLIRTSRRMMSETGREPTTDELAERLSIPFEKVAKLLDIARRPVKIDAR
jgi:RNA polymerase primary sigma factor